MSNLWAVAAITATAMTTGRDTAKAMKEGVARANGSTGAGVSAAATAFQTVLTAMASVTAVMRRPTIGLGVREIQHNFYKFVPAASLV